MERCVCVECGWVGGWCVCVNICKSVDLYIHVRIPVLCTL